jgi:hypothetical protein
MPILAFLRAIRTNLPMLVMAMCIGEAAIAFFAMFVFPPLSLAMVFIGLLTLAIAPLVGRGLEQLANLVAYLLRVEDDSPEDLG